MKRGDWVVFSCEPAPDRWDPLELDGQRALVRRVHEDGRCIVRFEDGTVIACGLECLRPESPRT